MNATLFRFHWRAPLAWVLLASLALFPALPPAQAAVNVRLSFKFVLNASGNRPATGDINTDAEVNTLTGNGNTMYSQLISELRLQNIEIVDAAGISQWYTADPTTANRDGLRSAAIANPATYHWRTDAVNVYITGGSGAAASGIADFPPNNNIILLPQSLWDNTVGHECGHILNLLHTHETCCYPNQDGCDDTLADNAGWTQDDIAVNNFGGLHYNQLTPAQQDQVNLVWFNLMSYHNGNTAYRLSGCQMDRQSLQAYADRNWMLPRAPVYIDAAFGGFLHDGSFVLPFQTVQQAINADALGGRVMVLKQGAHTRPTSAVNADVEVVTRRGVSTIQCNPVPYALPTALEDSTNAAVRAAVIRAQQCDRKGDVSGVITNLVEAEKFATGREQTALQLELAQRHRDSGQRAEAAAWFTKAAYSTDQEPLRARALSNAAAMTADPQAQTQPQSQPARPTQGGRRK